MSEGTIEWKDLHTKSCLQPCVSSIELQFPKNESR